MPPSRSVIYNIKMCILRIIWAIYTPLMHVYFCYRETLKIYFTQKVKMDLPRYSRQSQPQFPFPSSSRCLPLQNITQYFNTLRIMSKILEQWIYNSYTYHQKILHNISIYVKNYFENWQRRGRFTSLTIVNPI